MNSKIQICGINYSESLLVLIPFSVRGL